VVDEPPARSTGVPVEYRDGLVPPIEAVLDLYRALEWSSADKPEELAGALAGSHPRAVGFYEKCGFSRAADCRAMWIYAGTDHD